ncbi:MAG: maleylpyruvate isomerase family mycothiol-dependent enzyme [Acidimicrobiia bacterium]
MDHTMLIDVITDEASALAAAARATGPDAPVPATPEWSMAKLVKHTGTTHRWVLAIATTREFANPGDLDLGLPEDPALYPEWLEAGTATLTSTLSEIDPLADMWSWGVDQHARFWSRRMAHETAVHRWDAQSAQGTQDAIRTDVAVDGIDERLENLTPSMNFNPAGAAALCGTGETVHFHVTDAEGEWLLRFDPDGVAMSREHAKGDVAVRGPANDLLLYLNGRRPLDGLEVFGDAGVLDAHAAMRSF